MHTTTVQRRFEVSANRVWAAFDDFGGILAFIRWSRRLR